MSYPILAPYITYSLKLAAKPRKGGGNMFRHQVETMAILLEYGYSEPVLLKAALIHDLLEDGDEIGFTTFAEIPNIDGDGLEVLDLVKEVSQQILNGVNEPKSEFLLRIMLDGSENAKILKLADRISNISSLPMAGNKEFMNRYIFETEQYIIPHASLVNQAMAAELINRVESMHKIQYK